MIGSVVGYVPMVSLTQAIAAREKQAANIYAGRLRDDTTERLPMAQDRNDSANGPFSCITKGMSKEFGAWRYRACKAFSTSWLEVEAIRKPAL